MVVRLGAGASALELGALGRQQDVLPEAYVAQKSPGDHKQMWARSRALSVTFTEPCGIDMAERYNNSIPYLLAAAGILAAAGLPLALFKLGLTLTIARAVGICGGLLLVLLSVTNGATAKKLLLI